MEPNWDKGTGTKHNMGQRSKATAATVLTLGNDNFLPPALQFIIY
jgi:hypothetical protein